MSKVEENIKKNNSLKNFSLSEIKGNLGPSVVDIRKLYSENKIFTYDPGFTSTASCKSKITFIDGEKGVLLHRGYNIEELAKKSSFLEVAYLLLNEELPTHKELETFSNKIKNNYQIDPLMKNFFNGFKNNAHPMAIVGSIVSALSANYQSDLDIRNKNKREEYSIDIIAKISTIAAMSYRHISKLPFIDPSKNYSYSGNFLKMMFSDTNKSYNTNSTVERAIDKILILHADHEQNASTSTVRLTGSSLANPFACISAGISSLWGPSHGGANEAVLDMLKEIGSKNNIQEYIKKAKDKNDSFRLMGFGHRVYKNYDPRATVLRQNCHEVLEELGIQNDPLLELAKELEKIALEDEYFVNKKLFPNVDFYSGIILKAIGIPTSMFTVMFALARTTGWISQWNEMIEDTEQKIGRPRQLYIGKTERKYVKIQDRV